MAVELVGCDHDPRLGPRQLDQIADAKRGLALSRPGGQGLALRLVLCNLRLGVDPPNGVLRAALNFADVVRSPTLAVPGKPTEHLGEPQIKAVPHDEPLGIPIVRSRQLR